MKRILIIGATSAIAQATMRIWAQEKNKLHLVGRNKEKLHSIAMDLSVLGDSVITNAVLDLNHLDAHQSMLDEAVKILGGIDIVLIAYGTLGHQKTCELDASVMLQNLHTNAISIMSLLTYLANILEEQKNGIIAVISSVAGDRGRQSNYVYGTAKGALSLFLQGLRQRLYKSGVSVLTIKPGFVDTPMTQAFRKGLLWTTPGVIAKSIVAAVAGKKNTIYAPGYWWIIMQIIQWIPERYFKWMSL